MTPRELVIQDWPRKLVAIFFAAMIWYSISIKLQETETIRDIRLQIVPAPDIVILNEEALPTVELTVRGSKRALELLTSNNIEVEHRIPSDIKAGKYEAFIRPRQVKLPRQVRIEDIQPERFTVQLDRRLTEDLPVRPRFTGQPPQGLTRKEVAVWPKDVRVTGPSTQIRDLEEILTEPIELDENIPTSFRVDIPLVNPSPDTIQLSPQEVEVSVEMSRTNGEILLRDIHLNVNDVPGSAYYVSEFIDPPIPRVQAVIEGPRSTVDYLTNASVRAFIDISNIRVPDDYTLPVQIWINAKDTQVRDQSIRPRNIQVRIAKRASDTPAGAAQAVTPTQ